MRQTIIQEETDEAGFLEAFLSGMSLCDSFAVTKPRLSLPREAVAALDELFSDFGKGYLDQELAKLDSAIGTLESVCKRLEEQMPISARVGRTVIFAVALGVIILLL